MSSEQMTFELRGHGLGEDAEAVIEGESIGQVIDKALGFFRVTSEDVRGIKLYVNGVKLWLKRQGKE